MERFIQNGELTEEGKKLAGIMFNGQCDRVPCSMCSKRNKETKGPGGPNCPGEYKLTERSQVDEVLTIHMGKKPGLEALDSILLRE